MSTTKIDDLVLSVKFKVAFAMRIYSFGLVVQIKVDVGSDYLTMVQLF